MGKIIDLDDRTASFFDNVIRERSVNDYLDVRNMRKFEEITIKLIDSKKREIKGEMIFNRVKNGKTPSEDVWDIYVWNFPNNFVETNRCNSSRLSKEIKNIISKAPIVKKLGMEVLLDMSLGHMTVGKTLGACKVTPKKSCSCKNKNYRK